MNAYVAGLLGFVIGSVVTWLVAEIDRAPEGWQDERGFYYGKPEPAEYTPDEYAADWAERERPEP